MLVAAASLLAPGAGGAAPAPARGCGVVMDIAWTHTADGHVTHGRRYRVESERLSCFVVTRLVERLIPLRTQRAFEAGRPPGYVCAALGTAGNPYRPATAVGVCLQKPLASQPPRSFSWRPVS